MALPGAPISRRNEANKMTQAIHQYAIKTAQQAIDLMDELMRDRIDMDTYKLRLNALEVDGTLDQFPKDFKQDPKSVYCLEIFMIISSLQHELEFQVAEYGANVASEDIRMLTDLLHKLTMTDS
jgi:hypothetical protein